MKREAEKYLTDRAQLRRAAKKQAAFNNQQVRLMQDYFEFDRTGCCALVQLRGGNDSTPEYVQTFCRLLEHQSKFDWLGTPVTGAGATCVFAIVSPHEGLWRETLEHCGFKPTHTFERRTGYPGTGSLVMYTKNII